MFARRGGPPREGRVRALAIACVLVVGCGSFRKNGLGGSDEDLGDASLVDGALDAGDGRVDASCTAGETCQGGAGTCLAGVCCDGDHACGSVCCVGSAVCAFGGCVVPGAPCGGDRECAASEVCDYDVLPAPAAGDAGPADSADARDAADASDAAVIPACVAKAVGHCIPRPRSCGAGDPSPTSEASPCIGACPRRLATAYVPKVTRSWGGVTTAPFADDVETTPVVAQLDDDDCNGTIDERDVPDLVFQSFAGGDVGNNGVLHALTATITGGGGFVEKWSVPVGSGISLLPWSTLAAGDLDGTPGAEIVACTSVSPQRVRVFGPNGKERFTSAPLAGCVAPSIADLDGDGAPEILTEGAIVDGQKGTKVVLLSPAPSGFVVAADVTGDGKLDVVSSAGVWNVSGARIADATAATVPGGPLPPMNFLSIADLDLDGKPEVIAIDWTNHALAVWQYDPIAASGVKVVRRNVDLDAGFVSPCPPASAGSLHGGGSPVIARFDGDAYPDVGVGGAVAYAVFSGRALMDVSVPPGATRIWAKPISSCAYGLAGSSAFDFDGDGKHEILFGGDQGTLTIFRGSDGSSLWSTCASSYPLVAYPFVADVDADGVADIVSVASTRGACFDGTKQAGVRIFSQDGWPRARRWWNEFDYHATNVGDQGAIPQHEPSNWTTAGLNDDRRSSVAGANDAPDLVVSVHPRCLGSTYALVARVRNVGAAPLEVPVNVRFFAGDTLLGERHTVHVISPGASELVLLELTPPPPGVAEGTTKVHAVIEDAIVASHECRADDNRSADVSGRCLTPP